MSVSSSRPVPPHRKHATTPYVIERARTVAAAVWTYGPIPTILERLSVTQHAAVLAREVRRKKQVTRGRRSHINSLKVEFPWRASAKAVDPRGPMALLLRLQAVQFVTRAVGCARSQDEARLRYVVRQDDKKSVISIGERKGLELWLYFKFCASHTGLLLKVMSPSSSCTHYLKSWTILSKSFDHCRASAFDGYSKNKFFITSSSAQSACELSQQIRQQANYRITGSRSFAADLQFSREGNWRQRLEMRFVG